MKVASDSPRSRRLFLWLACMLLPFVVLISESAAWWWKNPPEPEEGRKVLEYSFPRNRENAEVFPVTKAVEEALFFDRSQSGWISSKGKRVSVNYFEWNDTESSGLEEAFSHPPEECMGNIGNEVQAFLPPRQASVDGDTLVFDVTQFRDKGLPLFIFKLSWAEGMEGMNLLREGPGKGSDAVRTFKVKAVAKRWFPNYARVLMLGVHGADSDDEAWEVIEETILDDLTFRWIKP